MCEQSRPMRRSAVACDLNNSLLSSSAATALLENLFPSLSRVRPICTIAGDLVVTAVLGGLGLGEGGEGGDADGDGEADGEL